MKKISIKQKTIIIIALILIVVILSTIFTVNIMKNKNLSKEGYMGATANASSTLVASYIKKGITIGGITGTLEILDTSDATAKPEDIAWGKTGYVKGEKVTGTRIDTVSQGKEAKIYFDTNTRLIDDLNNNVVIPEGFKIAEDSGTKVEDGIVIEDKDGNQFVWIPAKTGDGVTVHTKAKGDVTIVYKRTDYGKQYGSYSDYSETLPTDEKTSVNANGGYYIGRFEAGDKESTEAKTMRAGETENRTVTIKKDQVPYNYVSISNCKSLAERMSSTQGYSAKTKLVSSYAWDTAISIMQITNKDYGKSSEEGNYNDTTFYYTDITGAEKAKNNGSNTLVPTGQTAAVCNIYDIGGNLWEYTTESSSYIGGQYTMRGGCYDNSYAVGPAGNRSNYDGNAYSAYGFRITLYL